MKNVSDCSLYGIVDLGYVSQDAVVEMAEKLCLGGVDILQLRAKRLDLDSIERLGRLILPVTRKYGVPFIINDHVEIAVKIDADGVHVGQDDRPIAEVRALMGAGKIVGKSTHSLEQAAMAMQEDVDYIGFGPLYATGTKPDYIPIGLNEIAVMEKFATKPAFCIGGVNADRLDEILAAGAKRVVVVSAFLQADDVVEAVDAVKNRVLARADEMGK